jgi:predicted secreted Zn-dependent protease
VTYYDVHGSTLAELRADMRRLGPRVNGTSYVGETRSPMRYSWRTSSIRGMCSVTDVRVTMNAQILLPRWTAPADADSALVAEWKRFVTALEVHEAGHKDISARAGREIVDRLRDMSGLCAQIGNRASELARGITERARLEQERYDAETAHGLTQGTTFGSPAIVFKRSAAGPRPAIAGLGSDSLRALFAAERAQAESAAALVTRLVVTPTTLDLRVGERIASLDLFRRLDVRGVTAAGDTLRIFARTFSIEPSPLIELAGRMIVARRAGDAALWVVVGTDAGPRSRDSTRAIRVLIHIR